MSEQSERLYDAITQVDDALVESARVKKHPAWRMLTALAAAVALVIGLFAWQPWHLGGTAREVTKQEQFALARPVYPVMAAYPNEEQIGDDDDALMDAFRAWQADIERQADQPDGYADGLEPYLRESARIFLSDSEDENRAYSPLNVYMALAMLAETAEGSSRDQILTLLGAANIDALRSQAGAVWNANYRDDGMTKSVLASALWLRDDTEYTPATVETLAQRYYASVFRGEMGSDAYNQALQDWLNEQTGDMLTEQAAQERFDARTMLGITTTIYFRTKWIMPFDESATKPEVFHAAAGDETADFMHRSETMYYCWGENFGAVGLPLESGGEMWLLLPDEGVAPQMLFDGSEAMDFMMTGNKYAWANGKDVVVNLAMPKFDTTCRYSLLEGLKAMGVTDICDPEKADFSTLLPGTEGAALNTANHAVRIAIDEEGVAASAYTVLGRAGAGMPPDDEIDFVLDRPFVYVITGDQGLPLFIGIVNYVSDVQ